MYVQYLVEEKTSCTQEIRVKMRKWMNSSNNAQESNFVKRGEDDKIPCRLYRLQTGYKNVFWGVTKVDLFVVDINATDSSEDREGVWLGVLKKGGLTLAIKWIIVF